MVDLKAACEEADDSISKSDQPPFSAIRQLKPDEGLHLWEPLWQLGREGVCDPAGLAPLYSSEDVSPIMIGFDGASCRRSV